MIYFVCTDDDPSRIKIGWTTDLSLRLKGIQTGASGELVVKRSQDGERWAEKWFHREFSDRHIVGEWFSFSDLMLTLQLPEEMPDDLVSWHRPWIKRRPREGARSINSPTFYCKFRPTFGAMVRSAAATAGQSLSEWMERAALDRLRATEGEPAD